MIACHNVAVLLVLSMGLALPTHESIDETGRPVIIVGDHPVLLYLDHAGQPHGGGRFGSRQIYYAQITHGNAPVDEAGPHKCPVASRRQE